MKNKDNVNVFESFQKFMTDSNLKKYTPTILMSDNDSTFINDKFKTNLIYNNMPEPKNHKRFSKLSKYIQNNIQASEVKKLTDLNTIDMNLWESL